MSERARRWRLAGKVQGVGLRPFVARTARRLELRGRVWNEPAGVVVEAEGAPEALLALDAALRDPPPPARVARCQEEPAPTGGWRGFEVVDGGARAEGNPGVVAPDAALCAACADELADPGSRRFGHALISCTACGPRWSVLRALPFDRACTTLAGFPLCPACALEHAAPDDRRFHAQTISCPACGPQLELRAPDGRRLQGDPIAAAAARLAAGGLLLVKGLGGWHLACRADDAAALARLRTLKRREAKPFALLVGSLAAAEALVALSPAGRAALAAPEAPVVLAPRRPGARVADAVAPGLARLGVMLPATPVQWLLARDPALGGVPLVMTSANGSGEPTLADDEEARRRLGPGVDAVLGNDREIRRAVDDSVLLDLAGEPPLVLRRARGWVPRPLALPLTGPPGVAVGGDLKAVLGAFRADALHLTAHLGDLDDPAAHAGFQRALEELLELMALAPAWVACDAHPDYRSAGLARALARARGLPLLAVQHHHAHAAAVLAEHGRSGPALALAIDGAGWGPDGTVWGGELLRCDLRRAERLGRLRPFRLLGGDAAARDPRRCALALLEQAWGPGAIEAHPAAQALLPDPGARALLGRMAASGLHAPWTSSAGRLCDGVAALLGVATAARWEAEPAQRLEAAALDAAPAPGAPACELVRAPDGLLEVDPAPLLRWLVEARAGGAPVAPLAAAFHARLGAGLAAALRALAAEHELGSALICGGAAQNALLLAGLRAGAGALELLRPRELPPGDGALAAGQAAVALARLAAGEEEAA